MAKTNKEATTKQVLTGPKAEAAANLAIARKGFARAQEAAKAGFEGAGDGLLALLGYGLFEVPEVAEVHVQRIVPEAKLVLDFDALEKFLNAHGSKVPDFMVRGKTASPHDRVNVALLGGVAVEVTISEPVLRKVAAVEAP